MPRSSKTLGAVASRVARRATVPGARIGKPIDINRIMCPLRYDIRVRIDFLRLLRDESALYEEDFAAFREQPEVKAYFAWFKDVRCARFYPKLLSSPERLEAGFIERVCQTAQLWRSVERNGFDISNPIRLGSGLFVRRVNGKVINGRIFAGDGCHRIACLYLAGQRYLEPANYEVAVKPVFEPLDNTAILIRSQVLDMPTYLRYLSQFYCEGLEFDSVNEIQQYVLRRKPALVRELESVLNHDLARMQPHG